MIRLLHKSNNERVLTIGPDTSLYFSYEALVMIRDKGTFIRIKEKQSKTTERHIRAWLIAHDINPDNPERYTSLPESELQNYFANRKRFSY